MRLSNLIRGVTITLLLVFSFHSFAGDKVFFYIHGADIHSHGVDSKRGSEYKKIVDQLKSNGFDVIFEFRPEDDFEAQATLTANSVKEKIASGTAPKNIIIGGFSYGSLVSQKVSEILGDKQLNYALISGCHDNPNKKDIDFSALQGRILSIYDVDDHKFGSCKDRMPPSVDFIEHELNSGKGHKLFRLSKEKFFNQWFEVFSSWANN